MEGKKVRIVEMRDVLAPDANVRHRPLLLKEIDKYAEVYTGYKGLEVTEEGVWCEDKEGKKGSGSRKHHHLCPGPEIQNRHCG